MEIDKEERKERFKKTQEKHQKAAVGKMTDRGRRRRRNDRRNINRKQKKLERRKQIDNEGRKK